MKYLSKLRWLFLICVCLLPKFALAADGINITDVWAWATPGQATNCAVYLTIRSGENDTVLAASTPIAASASLHVHQMVDGVAKMMPVSRVDIVAGTPFRFAPMGYHIMLAKLRAPLKAGDTFPLTLQFDKAGSVAVLVSVRPLRDRMPTAAMSAMPGMGSMPGMSGMDMSK